MKSIHAWKNQVGHLLMVILSLAYTLVHAEEINIAVAANFASPVQKIIPAFEQATGHKVLVSLGSTGKFYAQIKAGAPFQVLLAADDETPKKLIEESAAVSGSNFTYAIGKLVLWSAKPGVVDERGDVLLKGNVAHVAIANPKLAPYGAAAIEAMKKLNVYDKLETKLVQGESITQAYQFIASGNAEIGFVALSQVFKDGQVKEGSAWIVPAKLYTPLLQDAVLLNNGKDSAGAKAWLAWLKGEQAQAVIRSFGYDLADAKAMAH